MEGTKESRPNTLLLRLREYEGVKDGLVYPSDGILETICELGTKFYDLFCKYFNETGVKRKIVNNLFDIDHSWFCCPEHDQQVWDYILDLYVKIMLYNKVKQLSSDIRDRKRPAKKLKKLN